MNQAQKARYETLAKVTKFGAENRELFPDTSVGGQAFVVVANAVAAIEQHLTRHVVARDEAQRVKAATKAAVYEYMKTIARTARQVTKRDSEGYTFKTETRRSATAILATARAFVEHAGKRQDEFVRQGLPPTFVADFAALVAELDKAVNRRLTSGVGRRQAQTGIATAIAEGLDAVRQLDVFVPNTLRLDPVRLSGWASARRISGVSGSASAKTDVPGAQPTSADASPEVVKAATAQPLEKVS